MQNRRFARPAIHQLQQKASISLMGPRRFAMPAAVFLLLLLVLATLKTFLLRAFSVLPRPSLTFLPRTSASPRTCSLRAAVEEG